MKYYYCSSIDEITLIVFCKVANKKGKKRHQLYLLELVCKRVVARFSMHTVLSVSAATFCVHSA